MNGVSSSRPSSSSIAAPIQPLEPPFWCVRRALVRARLLRPPASPPMPQLRRSALLALPLALLAACGDSTRPEDVALAKLTFDVAALDTLSELATRQLKVAGIDGKGRTMT